MNRFEWFEVVNNKSEDVVAQQSGVRLYNGMRKTNFDNGVASLTTLRLLWRDSKDLSVRISLPLSYVASLEEQASGIAKSAKIVIHVGARRSDAPLGPISSTTDDTIRLSFREAGMREFYRCFTEVLVMKLWNDVPKAPALGVTSGRQKVGIVGIERSIQQKQTATNQNISKAFEDLGKLMEKAKEMVALSKGIAQKIKERQGNITEDETIMFKSYLLSMGIPDPVTRETHGTGANYYSELARQLAKILQKPIEEIGGTMTLTDVYCRVNRARGMELLSPEDLLNACNMLDILNLPIRLREFDSGVVVVQLRSHSEEKIVRETTALVEENKCLSAQDLAQIIGLSVVLAKERLLLTERHAAVCRDDCVEGLRFYPNQFISQPPTTY